MFLKTAHANKKDTVPLICEHLGNLVRRIEKYFPNISVESSHWLTNPLVHDPLNKPQFNLLEEEERTDICNDSKLKLNFLEMSLETIWIHNEEDFRHMAKKAQKILVQFSASYLCELEFLASTNRNTKKR